MKNIFIICSLFAFLTTALYGKEKMPKIRVADDKQSFVTDDGKPFIPFGVNYFRSGTGWAPQLWKTFDEKAFREDFALMKEAGVNCVRIFLTYGSFLTEKDRVNDEGLEKFDKLLDIAEEYGIYIHPTGPDHWEGPGIVGDHQNINERFTDDKILEATLMFWKVFAARYKGRNALFAYDLLNEPSIPWDSPSIKPKWNKWLKNRYSSAKDFAAKCNVPLDSIQWGKEDAPKDFTNKALILAYQHFREEQADHWTQVQVKAIKSVDPDALVTVGFIQWSIPTVLPGLQHYAAFKPSRQAPFLDFMEFHFYPLATGFYEYEKEGDTEKNLAYVESLAREVAATGKPVVIAEHGWYGGGKLQNSNQDKPAATERQQADWNTAMIATTKGLTTGWLNWGFFDMPESRDITELLGLYTVDRRPKAWGIAFKQLSEQLSGQAIAQRQLGERPVMDWDILISDPEAAPKYLEAYTEAFIKDRGKDLTAKQYKAPESYIDGRSQAALRMKVKDEGMVMPYGTGPDSCDTYGAREAVVVEYEGRYYLHYDGAGKESWLSCLATSHDLREWQKQGPQLSFGAEGAPDSRCASSPWFVNDGTKWHMFYGGTQFCSPAPYLIPAVPYVTLKAEASHPAGPWTKRYDIIPFTNEPGTYYSDTASPGDVVKNGDEYMMFFGAAAFLKENVLGRTVGIARTKNLDSAWKVDPDPIFPHSEQCENTSLYYEPTNQTWFLFTNHIGIDPVHGEYTDAIWVYWSKDLNVWDADNKAIVLDCENTKEVKGAIGMPSVIKAGNRLAILYDGATGEDYWHMNRNINLAWIDLPLTPPTKTIP